MFLFYLLAQVDSTRDVQAEPETGPEGLGRGVGHCGYMGPRHLEATGNHGPC